MEDNTSDIIIPQAGTPVPGTPPQPDRAPTQLDETEPLSPAPDSSSFPAMPKRIGKYKLMRVIGAGGMGVVYEALQDEPRRTVALKVMKDGLKSDVLLGRFHLERDTLARLQHPGIARIYDAGTEASGDSGPIPYFVMEYVRDAATLTAYADRQKLDIRARVKLFVLVCRAVEYGHSRNFIHRDIKPANILVDPDGQPKVIDFGVARTMPEMTDDAGRITQTGQVVGTIQYMSPEQVDGKEIDRRTDVYSLGVTLYELLCGKLPIEVDRAAVLAATRAIVNREPVPPSRYCADIDSDLERVILRSLEKDRTRRYDTAHDLAEELERWLRGDPLLTRPATFAGTVIRRTQRLAVRHVAMAVTVLLAFAAVAGTEAAKAIASLTRVGPVWNRFATSTFVSPSAQAQFGRVRILGITDTTDLEKIAAAENLEGISNADARTWRRLHGRAMEKLATLGPSVVVFDVAFDGDHEFDKDFVAGVQALNKAGIAVVAVSRTWKPSINDNPRPSTLIKEAVALGGATINSGDEIMNPTLDLAVRNVDRDIVPSIALQAIANSRWPLAQTRIEADEERRILRIINISTGADALKSDTVSQAIEVRYTRAVHYSPNSAGIEPGAFIATFLPRYPSVSVFDSSTIDYTSLFLDPASVETQVRMRAVIIQNLRRGVDRQTGGAFKEVPGAFFHAAAIDELLIAEPWGFSYWTLPVIAVASSLIGLSVAALTPASLVRRAALLGLVLALAVAVSMTLAMWQRIIMNPLTLAMPAVIAALGCAPILAARRARIMIDEPWRATS